MRTLLVAVMLLAATLVAAQTDRSKVQGRDELRFTLILSRHGIRPPLTADSVLNLHSADPWPGWEVPLGYLTPHGAVAIQQMGAYMRQDFARHGLLPATGCPGSNDIYIYSDTDERNVTSTRSTFAGLEPGCDPRPIHTIAPVQGVRDPLFSPIPGTFPAPPAEVAEAGMKAILGDDPAAFFSLAGNPELKEFAHILAPDAAHPAAKPILDDPRPLTAASAMIEDVFLEFIDAKPMAEVGWGRLDEATLLRLRPLHAKQFILTTRSPLSARTSGSNMVAHILDTMEQATESRQGATVPGALGPAGTHLVYISGHDSNLCNVGGLLNLHWKVDGVADDTPPDSQIVFELWQNSQSKQWSVRLLYRGQTMDQLRSAESLSATNRPVEVPLTPPGCAAGKPCSFTAFARAAHALLDPARVQQKLPPMQVAPPTP